MRCFLALALLAPVDQMRRWQLALDVVLSECPAQGRALSTRA